MVLVLERILELVVQCPTPTVHLRLHLLMALLRRLDQKDHHPIHLEVGAPSLHGNSHLRVASQHLLRVHGRRQGRRHERKKRNERQKKQSRSEKRKRPDG